MSVGAVPSGLTRTAGQRPARRTVVAVVAGTLAVGALAGSLAASGSATDVVALAALLLPVAIWRRPSLGPMIIFLTGLLIEQFPLDLTSGTHVMNVPITNSIPIFNGIGSLHLEPADLLFLSVVLVYLLKSRSSGTHWHPKGPLALSVLAVFGAMVFGLVLGVAHHGAIRESLQECRPVIYFVATYALTASMIRTRAAIHAMLWALTIAEAIKALQGLAVWVATRKFVPEPQNILGHEESMCFSLFFLMVAALWLYGMKGRLRTVSTSLVPLVLFTDMVNDRRVAWLILPVGLVVMAILGYRALPERRRLIMRILGVTALILAVYLPAYWNHPDGTLGKPASAISSQFGKANPRDALSDDYRVQEDANLELNIKQGKVLGLGYGRQINYALPMPGLVVAVDASILYVPHNGVLYELMRLGIIGGIAFWMLFGTAIISGSRLARAPDRELAMIGAMAASMTVGWAMMGALDMGFVFDRVMIMMGCLLGLSEAARHIQADATRRRRAAERRRDDQARVLVHAGEA